MKSRLNIDQVMQCCLLIYNFMQLIYDIHDEYASVECTDHIGLYMYCLRLNFVLYKFLDLDLDLYHGLATISLPR
jgi:hypothetical protein